ncbi:hypothetical protein PSAB6_150015 [Paraburkholderia sabiae]|nr:hypothetical protein PSAB6_150015 [Paraburkholderia sabiae]
MSRLIFHSVLDGWKAVDGDGDQTARPSDDAYAEIADSRDALQQIAHLREAIRQKQIEIDVLVEALDYARSIAPHTCEHE